MDRFVAGVPDVEVEDGWPDVVMYGFAFLARRR
jgi:hypothetical protein